MAHFPDENLKGECADVYWLNANLHHRFGHARLKAILQLPKYRTGTVGATLVNLDGRTDTRTNRVTNAQTNTLANGRQSGRSDTRQV